MSATLHVLHHAMECALADHELTIPTTISKDTLEKVKLYVDHVENQKYMLCEVRDTSIDFFALCALKNYVII